MNIDFPLLNACLNGSSGIFLITGYYFIKRKNVSLHKACMFIALLCSTVFLACYLYYHYHHGSTRFQGEGMIRFVYFSILISHTILAVVMLPMIIKTLYHAAKKQFDKHIRIARITFPIWLYVSATGVVIYWMLYRMPV